MGMGSWTAFPGQEELKRRKEEWEAANPEEAAAERARRADWDRRNEAGPVAFPPAKTRRRSR